ncbi:hypothetical protein [Hymenobacter ruricola]|uniref:Uncharacterized protein n=1 Tax=Hymenobacter ruricola TaxID=2791023 RepID=A0ABS0I7J8_9BACT|nr:hypothetical protein [Hymenobacter ruricola]MBF9222494.1 hypothetical protein [Hymenobacter ruricola]
MPDSSYAPFSGPNPLQPELIALCQERNIDAFDKRGRQLSNSTLQSRIKKHEIDKFNRVSEKSAELFPLSTVDEEKLPTILTDDDSDEIKAYEQEKEIPPLMPTADTVSSEPSEVTVSASEHRDLSSPSTVDPEDHGLAERDDTLTSGGLLDYITGNFALDKQENPNDAPPVYTGPFYLQMQAVNLGTYLSRGAIYPLDLEPDQEYISVRPVDFLTQHRSYLPLLTGHLTDFSEKEALVELLLRPNEIEHLQTVGSVYRFGEIIPVSRIRRVLFISTDAIDEFRVNAEQFKNYFFPKSLVGVIGEDIPSVKVEFFGPSDSSDLDPIVSHQLRQFDRQLGMFGYLKHAPLLRANTEQSVQDFPAELLIGLHEINAAIAAEEGNAWVMNTLLRRGPQKATSAGQKLFAAIVQAIYQDETASYEWGIRLLQQVESQCRQQSEIPRDLPQLKVAQEQLGYLQQGQGNFSKALTAIASSDGIKRDIPPLPFTALVLLCNKPGRARSSEDKQAVLINLAQYTNRGLFNAPMLLDQLLAVLGLYYGYAQFTRQDPNLKIESPELDKAAQPLHRLRFDIALTSDRIIIESVFRYCVEGQPINDALAYLRPSETNVSDQVVFPQRAFRLGKSTVRANTTYNQPSKTIRDQKPSVSRFRDAEIIDNQYQQTNSATSPAVLEEIILKMTRWFSPAHFEQQLLSGFTPAEQEALRLLIQSRKAR